MQEIDIDISPNGDVTIEGKSENLGADCKALTAEIEKALGVVTASTVKPSFYRARAVTRKVGG